MWPDNDSKSKQYFERAKKVIPMGFSRTWNAFEPYPIYVQEAKGCRITDIDGTERLDFLNNYSCCILGHCHPALMNGAIEQIKKSWATGCPHIEEVKAAEILCARNKTFEKVKFMSSGTEAVILGTQIAHAYTGSKRPKIAKFEGGYHGCYNPVMISHLTLDGNFGPIDNPRKVPTDFGIPESTVNASVILPFNHFKETQKILEQNAKELSCILVDLNPWRTGFTSIDPEYLQMIRDFADIHDIVLIFDEVVSFRLATGGAQTRYKTKPDITVLGKSLAGGFPIGAIAGLDKFMSLMDVQNGAFPKVVWGGSFTGNPLSMVGVQNALNFYGATEIQHLAKLGQRLVNGVTPLFQKYGIKGQIQGQGSLFTVILHDGRVFDHRSFFAHEEEDLIGEWMRQSLLKKGVVTATEFTIILSTPMGDSEIDFFINAFEQTLKEFKKDEEKIVHEIRSRIHKQ